MEPENLTIDEGIAIMAIVFAIAIVAAMIRFGWFTA